MKLNLALITAAVAGLILGAVPDEGWAGGPSFGHIDNRPVGYRGPNPCLVVVGKLDPHVCDTAVHIVSNPPNPYWLKCVALTDDVNPGDMGLYWRTCVSNPRENFRVEHLASGGIRFRLISRNQCITEQSWTGTGSATGDLTLGDCANAMTFVEVPVTAGNASLFYLRESYNAPSGIMHVFRCIALDNSGGIHLQTDATTAVVLHYVVQ